MLWGMITAPTIPTAYHKRNEKKNSKFNFCIFVAPNSVTDNEESQ